MSHIITSDGERIEVDRNKILHPTSVAGVAIVASEAEFHMTLVALAVEHTF